MNTTFLGYLNKILDYHLVSVFEKKFHIISYSKQFQLTDLFKFFGAITTLEF